MSLPRSRCAGSLLCSAALALLGTVILAAPASAASIHSFSESFGEAGSGPGPLELREHSGIAINDETGDLYIADTGNGRVSQFETGGTFIRSFGTLTTPTFIAID